MNNIDLEKLLPRIKIDMDWDVISRNIEGKSLLITGAAGSIGSELTLKIATARPRMLVLVDQAESPLHAMMLTMRKQFPKQDFLPVVTSITNETQMDALFSQFNPDFVFHAAAYKHVPMMEMNPAIAVQNNCLGTRVIANLAVKYGVKKFVMISTDKAVNPSSVMGASKRVCEIYCQSLNKRNADATKIDAIPRTQFVTTRFGNVLGSVGSVIPIFEQQIVEGGPVTVTHPDMERYFMLIPEACELVLEACAIGLGGEIYAFDMGKPMKIKDMACRMIEMYNAKNVEIKYTGLRDGEKLYEEVLNVEETTLPTSHPKIRVAKVREYDYDKVLRNELELERLSYTYDDMEIVKKMKEIVPEFKSFHSKYETLDSLSQN